MPRVELSTKRPKVCSACTGWPCNTWLTMVTGERRFSKKLLTPRRTGSGVTVT